MNDEHRSQTDLSFYNTCEGSLTSDRDLFMNTQTYTRKHTRIRSYTLPLLTAHLPTHIHTPTHPFDYKYTLTYIKFPLKINFVNISLSLILSSYILLWHFSVICLVSVFTHIFPVYFCFLHVCDEKAHFDTRKELLAVNINSLWIYSKFCTLRTAKIQNKQKTPEDEKYKEPFKTRDLLKHNASWRQWPTVEEIKNKKQIWWFCIRELPVCGNCVYFALIHV